MEIMGKIRIMTFAFAVAGLSVGAFSESPFYLRDTNWSGVVENRKFALEKGLNGNFAVRGWIFDRALSYAHTFENLVPKGWYYADHPEYFAFFGGWRRDSDSQLCLTNPGVLQLVIDRVKERIRMHPESKCFGVSQGDFDGWCECKECAKVRAASDGTEADAVITFVNKVAAAVKKEFPDKYIQTLAYQKSRKPPTTVKPADNVVVCLCPIECDFSRPFVSSGYVEDESFVRDLRGWAKLGTRLMIWDYTCDFHFYQQGFPNLEIMAENMKFYRDNGVWGVFLQGIEETEYGWLSEVKSIIVPELINNPDADVEKLKQETFKKVYGPAAPAMLRYYARWCVKREEIAAECLPYTIWCAPTEDFFPAAYYAELDLILQDAVKAAAGTPFAAAVTNACFCNDVMWGSQGDVEAARRALEFSKNHYVVCNEGYLRQHNTGQVLRKVVKAADEFENPVIPGDWPDPTVWDGGDGWYYSVATPVRRVKRSRNLVDWEDMDHDPIAYDTRNYLQSLTHAIWAPSVTKIGNKWMLYLSLFISGDDNRIEVLESDRPAGPFKRVGNVIDSRREKIPNTIDPYVLAVDGKVWMFFGSCQGGIHRVELTSDGRAIKPGEKTVHVAGMLDHPGVDQWGLPGAWEGSYVFNRGKWWYLFGSGGKFSDGTYHMVVGRSDRVDGVFFDREGHNMTEALAKPILKTAPRARFNGPGHNGDVFVDKDGKWWVFYHAHDTSNKQMWGRPTMLQELKWTEDDWPYFEGDCPNAGDRRPRL